MKFILRLTQDAFVLVIKFWPGNSFTDASHCLSVLCWASSITAIYQSSSLLSQTSCQWRERELCTELTPLRKTGLSKPSGCHASTTSCLSEKETRTWEQEEDRESLYLSSQTHYVGMIIYVSGPYLSQQIACNVQDNGVDRPRHHSSTMLAVREKAERH